MTAVDTAAWLRPGDQHNEIAAGTVNAGAILITPEGNLAVKMGLKPTLINEPVIYNNDQVFRFTNNAGNAYSEGQMVYWDGNNIQPTGFIRVGRCVQTVLSSSLTVDVRLLKDARGARYAQAAAGTALTNSTTATLLTSAPAIPANYLQVGDIIRIRGQGIVTSFNSSDTISLALQLIPGSGSTITLAAPTAYNGSANDIFTLNAELVVRTAGASGFLVGYGEYAMGANLTGALKEFKEASVAIDTTKTQTPGIQGTWSVANAGDSVRVDVFNVELSRA